GRVDRRKRTTEPALLLALRREGLLPLRERLPLLREGLSVRRLLLERLLSVRLAILLPRLLTVGLALLRLAAVPLARLLGRPGLRGPAGLLLGLGVLGELLRGRTVTARLT
ncbi:MAG TPA: hypothetical protein VFI00_00115, partial [Kribbella sp.]|nr:hypothetical protein [Kribbella sp.]